MSKCVVLGITGSIAAYKSAEIVSRLKKQGVDVRCILTRAGAEFITPLTLETLSGAPVVTDMFHRETPWKVEHISLAKGADVFLVAPASANFVGKLANGIADDMLTTTAMATKAQIVIAPAMNTGMLTSPAYMHNVEVLKSRGCVFIEPDAGMLACGDVGRGRLCEPGHIVSYVVQLLNVQQDLLGKTILVTAGPTIERIDPVRYITNRSTGKMGFAIANAAANRGASVTLISGTKADLVLHSGVKRIDITSSEDMYDAVSKEFDACDYLIMAAAPADFTPKVQAEQKIKKLGRSELCIEFVATKDILAAMGARKRDHQLIMGFAAETENIEENALLKLERKNVDFIAANDVMGTSTGFGVDTNSVMLYYRGGRKRASGLMTKAELSNWLLDSMIEHLR